jgi:hypothetical protein
MLDTMMRTGSLSWWIFTAEVWYASGTDPNMSSPNNCSSFKRFTCHIVGTRLYPQYMVGKTQSFYILPIRHGARAVLRLAKCERGGGVQVSCSHPFAHR